MKNWRTNLRQHLLYFSILIEFNFKVFLVVLHMGRNIIFIQCRHKDSSFLWETKWAFFTLTLKKNTHENILWTQNYTLIKTRGECYSESNNRKVFILAKFYFPPPQFIIKISRCQARCFGWLDKLPGIVLHNHKGDGSSIPEQDVEMLCLQRSEHFHPLDSCGWLKTPTVQFLQELQPDATHPILVAGTWTQIALKNNARCPSPLLSICYKLPRYIGLVLLSCLCRHSRKEVWTQFKLSNTGLTYYECKVYKRKQ